MMEIPRTQYISELSKWKDSTDIVKVIIGVRRSGKSTIMKQYIRKIESEITDQEDILYANFESSDFFEIRDYKTLSAWIAERISRNRRSYVFLDEVQRVEGWEHTVNSLMVDYDADIYITGSNAYLLSSELSTYLSGRYVEIRVYPLSFEEFLSRAPATPEINVYDRFEQYLRIGGFPLADPDNSEDSNFSILDGIYNTVLRRDVSSRVNLRDNSGLDEICRFLLDNTGNITNIDSIAKTTKLSKITVDRYIKTLTDAFLLYKVERFDVVGKKILNSHEKYYPVDTGLTRAILNRGNPDLSRPLENVVFLELVRRGYSVRVGSFRDREVDFTAVKNGKVEYYQVCLTMIDENTFEREVRSLKSIDDNYPKTVLSLDPVVRDLPDGLIHMNVVRWLLGKQ